MADPIPKDNFKEEGEHLEETEVITRIMFVLNKFKLFDLATLDWSKSWEDIGVDSLETIAIITSIEHECHTVIEDRVFDNMESLNDVKTWIATDHNCF